MKPDRAPKPGIAAFKAQKRAIERERMKPPAETDADLYRDRPSRRVLQKDDMMHPLPAWWVDND